MPIQARSRLLCVLGASAVQYSRMRTFQDQRHSIDQSMLQSITEIFVKHHAHHQFGVILLHRHQDLRPGCVMVHTRTLLDQDICSMEPWGSRELYPISFCLDSQKEFVPIEFSSTPATDPNLDFLSDMRSFLYENDLHEVLGISHLSPAERPWIEHLLPNGQGTISTLLGKEIESSGQAITATAWAFYPRSTGISVKVYKACVETESGGHKVKAGN